MRRLLLILSACCLLAVTAGCSDDGDEDKDIDQGSDPSSTSSLDPNTQRKPPAKTTPCKAAVSTTGAYKAKWNADDGQVRTGGKAIGDSGPDAVYTLTDRNNQVALYSPGPEFKGAISMHADGRSYSSDPADAESFDIDERGRHASVDTTLTAIDGAELGLVAEFTCGKQK